MNVKALIITIVLFVAIVFFAYRERPAPAVRYSPVLAPAAETPPPPRTQPPIRQVTYEVTCDHCQLTYMDEQGNIVQDYMRTSWHKSFIADHGQFLSVSAQNQKEDGSVNVVITMDGRTLKNATSNGGYVIASADYMVP